jgi:AcrR family transcriptional regulator
MEMRTTLLQAAEELLNTSQDGEISTRAVCAAAGVAPPVLYRLFGDKNGLLRSLVDFGFDRYLGAKRTAMVSADPVDDLRDGWNTHVEFALSHPAVYRLMYSPTIGPIPSAAAEALRLLRLVLQRCAEQGRLKVDISSATQCIMSANVGVALSLITQPAEYDSSRMSDAVRDAVHASVLVDREEVAGDRPAVLMSTVSTQLAALLTNAPPKGLSVAETVLLQEWLVRLGQTEQIMT